MVATRIISIFISFYLLGQLVGPSARDWREVLFPRTYHVEMTTASVNVP